MAFRAKTKDDDSESECGSGPSNMEDFSDSEKEEDTGPIAKRAGRLWGDALVEQGLLHKGSNITLDSVSENRVRRGVESYQLPTNANNPMKHSSLTQVNPVSHGGEGCSSTDDPFNDSAIDLCAETALCERLSDEGWAPRRRPFFGYKQRKSSIHYSRTRGNGPRGRMRCNSGGSKESYDSNALKRPRKSMAADRDKLLLPTYSLETLMATEFDSNVSIEQLGHEMAFAMGERNSAMIESIVRACGVEKAILLFEETRKVESTGGMMIDNGQRRRTPGGVFISLFKLDSDIPEDVKKLVFGETKQEARKVIRARRRNKFDFAENVAKLAELMKKEKEKDMNALKPLPPAENFLNDSISAEEKNYVTELEKAENNGMEM